MKTLTDLEPKETQLFFKHPTTGEPILTDEGEEICWNVVGRDSDKYLNASQDFLKHLESLGDKADKITSVEYKNQTSIMLSKVVTGWDAKFNPYMGGKYNEKRVIEILTKRNRWMSDQLDVFVSTRSNFFTA